MADATTDRPFRAALPERLAGCCRRRRAEIFNQSQRLPAARIPTRRRKQTQRRRFGCTAAGASLKSSIAADAVAAASFRRPDAESNCDQLQRRAGGDALTKPTVAYQTAAAASPESALSPMLRLSLRILRPFTRLLLYQLTVPASSVSRPPDAAATRIDVGGRMDRHCARACQRTPHTRSPLVGRSVGRSLRAIVAVIDDA
jgi:hypothetical protein